MKNYSSNYKERSKNTCLECGEDAIAVKVMKSSRSQTTETGMMWRCKNGHTNRTRKHELIYIKK